MVPGESVTDPVALTLALAGAAIAAGADVRVDAPVTGLRRDGATARSSSAGGRRGRRDRRRQRRRPARRRGRTARRRRDVRDLPAQGRVPRVRPSGRAARSHPPAGPLAHDQGRPRSSRRSTAGSRSGPRRTTRTTRTTGACGPRARRRCARSSPSACRSSRVPSRSRATRACARRAAASNYVIGPSPAPPGPDPRGGDPLHRADRGARDRRAPLRAGRRRGRAARRAGPAPARPGAAGARARRPVVVAHRALRGRAPRVSGPLILGIDEGTTAVKAALFDARLRPVRSVRRVVGVRHPQAGWVEKDPLEILEAVVDLVADLLADAPRRGRRVRAGPRGRVGPRLGRRDRRAAHAGRRLAGQARRGACSTGCRPRPREIRERSGLPLDPYFSAGKLAWLLRHDPAVAAARERGHAAPRDGRRLPRRPARRGVRDRRVDRLAHAAAPAGDARLGPPAAGAVRRAGGGAPADHRQRRRARRPASRALAGRRPAHRAPRATSRRRSPGRPASRRGR